MEGVGWEEVGVIDDRDDGFAFGVKAAGLGNEAVFTTGVAAEGVELECLAKKS